MGARVISPGQRAAISRAVNETGYGPTKVMELATAGKLDGCGPFDVSESSCRRIAKQEAARTAPVRPGGDDVLADARQRVREHLAWAWQDFEDRRAGLKPSQARNELRDLFNLTRTAARALEDEPGPSGPPAPEPEQNGGQGGGDDEPGLIERLTLAAQQEEGERDEPEPPAGPPRPHAQPQRPGSGTTQSTQPTAQEIVARGIARIEQAAAEADENSAQPG